MLMRNAELKRLDRLLAAEEVFTERHKTAKTAERLADARDDLLKHIHRIGCGQDLPLIVATERAIVEGDLDRYANSRSMTSSLKTALAEIATIERHIGIVDDPARYRTVDQAYSLPRNRRNGLPFDEARQALASHHARLGNLDKSRLGDDEKKVIDARKAAILAAIRLYTRRQARTLGVDLA